jgi:hypothetical protein
MQMMQKMALLRRFPKNGNDHNPLILQVLEIPLPFKGTGMIGINVGVPAPMAWFPFTGWNKSFFRDLHIQGKESIFFYTKQKVTMTRWFESPLESHHDPVWKTGQG